MLPPLNQIAAVIATAFFDLRQPSTPQWVEDSQPYLDVMLELKDLSGFYGIDPAPEVVVKFLQHAEPWTGALATHVKRQLRQLLKEANVSH